VTLFLQSLQIILLDYNILVDELDISLSHPILTSSTYPSELLASCFDIFQFEEISFAFVFFTLSTKGILQLISWDIGQSFLLWMLFVGIVIYLKVLHQLFLSLITPIHITDALLIIVKVPHMPGPVLAQHLVPTISAHVANGKSFLNLLSLLLSLPRNLVF
jgi:hypothetical protein